MSTLSTTVGNLLRRLARWRRVEEEGPRLHYTPPAPLDPPKPSSSTPARVARQVVKGALPLLLLLLGCGEEPEDPCVDELTWENFGNAFVHQYCTACHSSVAPETHRNGSPEEVNLDTYAGVLRWVDHIDASSTGESPEMPPGGGPTAVEVDLLAEWLDCTVRPDAYRAEGL